MNAQIIVVADSHEKLNEVDRVFYEISKGVFNHVDEIADHLHSAGFIHSELNFNEIAARIPLKKEWR